MYKNIRNILPILLILFFYPQVTLSQEKLECIACNIFWETCYDVKIQDNYAYVSTGVGGLKIIDITDPNNPYEVGYTKDFLDLMNICVHGDFVYGISDRRFVAIDISDKENPFVARAIRPFLDNETIFVARGKYLYTLSEDFFGIYDISVPESTMFIEGVGLDYYGWNSNECLNLAVPNDSTLYLTVNGSGIRTYDISDPAHFREIGVYRNGSYTQSLVVEGNRGYSFRGDNIEILDLTDRTRIRLISETSLGNTYVSNNNKIIKDGDRLYCMNHTGDDRIIILNVRNENSPARVGLYTDRIVKTNIAIKDNFMYLSCLDNGLKVLNLDEPNLPVLAAQINNQFEIYKFEIADGKMINVDDESFTILSMDDPTHIKPISSLPRDDHPYNVKVDSDLAYVYGNGFEIFNIEEENNPERILTTEQDNIIPRLFTHHDLLLYCRYEPDHGFDGTVLFRTSGKQKPIEIASIRGLRPFALDYPYLYGNLEGEDTDHNYFAVYDVSHPYKPEVKGTYGPLEGIDIIDVKPFNDIAYVRQWVVSDGYACYKYKIYNIEDPSNPFEAEEYERFCSEAAIYGHYMIGSSDEHSLEVYDISVPDQPVLAYIWDTYNLDGSLWIPGDLNAYYTVKVYDGLIYLIDELGYNTTINRMYVIDGTSIPGFIESDHQGEVIYIEKYSLVKTYPNPFNPLLHLTIGIPKPGDLKVQVYNINGQLVETLTDGRYTAGEHNLIFNGNGLSSGVYFINAVVPGEMNQTRKVTLVK